MVRFCRCVRACKTACFVNLFLRSCSYGPYKCWLMSRLLHHSLKKKKREKNTTAAIKAPFKKNSTALCESLNLQCVVYRTAWRRDVWNHLAHGVFRGFFWQGNLFTPAAKGEERFFFSLSVLYSVQNKSNLRIIPGLELFRFNLVQRSHQKLLRSISVRQ